MHFFFLPISPATTVTLDPVPGLARLLPVRPTKRVVLDIVSGTASTQAFASAANSGNLTLAPVRATAFIIPIARFRKSVRLSLPRLAGAIARQINEIPARPLKAKAGTFAISSSKSVHLPRVPAKAGFPLMFKRGARFVRADFRPAYTVSVEFKLSDPDRANTIP